MKRKLATMGVGVWIRNGTPSLPGLKRLKESWRLSVPNHLVSEQKRNEPRKSFALRGFCYTKNMEPTTTTQMPPHEHHHVLFVVISLSSLVLLFAATSAFLYVKNKDLENALTSIPAPIQPAVVLVATSTPQAKKLNFATVQKGDIFGDFTLSSITHNSMGGTHYNFAGTTTVRGTYAVNEYGLQFFPAKEDAWKFPELYWLIIGNEADFAKMLVPLHMGISTTLGKVSSPVTITFTDLQFLQAGVDGAGPNARVVSVTAP